MAEEYCILHPTELYVAHDAQQNKLLCNSCIYQSDIGSIEDAM